MKTITEEGRAMPGYWKTDAAEAALQEHLALTRKEVPAGSWATNYHKTITDLRAGLMRESVMFDRMCESHTEVAHRYGKDRLAWKDGGESGPAPERPDAILDAHTGTLMAAIYAYALAAVLKVAERDLSAEQAQNLAFEVDEILTNGDFESLNADVIPEGAAAPSAAQGIELVLGKPAQPEVASA